MLSSKYSVQAHILDDEVEAEDVADDAVDADVPPLDGVGVAVLATEALLLCLWLNLPAM